MLDRERNPYRYMEPSLDSVKRQGTVLRGGIQEERSKPTQKKPLGPSGLEQMLDTLKKSFRELF